MNKIITMVLLALSIQANAQWTFDGSSTLHNASITNRRNQTVGFWVNQYNDLMFVVNWDTFFIGDVNEEVVIIVRFDDAPAVVVLCKMTENRRVAVMGPAASEAMLTALRGRSRLRVWAIDPADGETHFMDFNMIGFDRAVRQLPQNRRSQQ